VLEAIGREPAKLLHAAGEPVTRALELREARQAGSGQRRVSGARRGYVREGLGDDRRELALEPGDLRP
jgi:hypothetical protein